MIAFCNTQPSPPASGALTGWNFFKRNPTEALRRSRLLPVIGQRTPPIRKVNNLNRLKVTDLLSAGWTVLEGAQQLLHSGHDFRFFFFMRQGKLFD